MSLQAKLDAFKADFEAGKPPYNVPRSVIETMHRATAELIASGAAQRAKKAGDVAPSFSLKDPEGNIVSSDQLLKKGPLVVSFYRGVWCPYCNMELQALEAAKPAFDKYGASLLANLGADRAEQPQINASEQALLPDPVGCEGQGRRRVWPALRSARLSDRALQEPQERSADVQRRSELDPADAGPLRDRPGRHDPLLRSEPRPEPEDMIPVLQRAAAVKV